LNRADGRLVGEMGRMGENGGQFFGLHMIAVDSQGNVYTGEVFQGERVQRFVPADSVKGRLLKQLPDTPWIRSQRAPPPATCCGEDTLSQVRRLLRRRRRRAVPR
jgi:hypothetical protein